MTEPAPVSTSPSTSSSSTPYFASWLRPIGYGLLILGFVWLALSAVWLPVSVVTATSRFASEGLPSKASYEIADIEAALSGLSKEIQSGLPPIMLPGLVMLFGALVLAQAPTRGEMNLPRRGNGN